MMKRLPHRTRRARALLAIVWCAAGLAFTSQLRSSAAQQAKPAFTFRNTEYFHRWSQNTQHEFTPAKQEDLKAWTDMITINLYPDAVDGDALAARANAALESYKAHKAIVLKTTSVPRTADQPAEHLIAVVFARPTFIEVAFARFKIVDGVGCTAVYSHRIYGEKIGDAMSAWLQANGPGTEKALMDWSSIRAAVAAARAAGHAKT